MKDILRHVLASSLIVVSLGVANAEGLVELTQPNYEADGKGKSILLLQINWGRIWNCGGYENAQIQNLTFTKFPHNGGSREPGHISFDNPSALTSKNIFLPYAYIIDPGKYALSAFEVKVSGSSTDVGHIKGTKESLIDGGQSIGGTFEVAANEAVYIGTFGLDCNETPVPWRYYIEGRDEFDKFIDGFRWKYDYLKNMPVAFRLFSTEKFGQPYSLD